MTTLNLSDYTIFIGDHSTELTKFLSPRDYTKIVVLVDENTQQHCLPVFLEQLNLDCQIIELPAGEKHKNLLSCRHTWEEMMAKGMDRYALLINLGGGVIGDLGGFCAATYLRGIDFIQMPTTLLSQVDASIGGKLGVDLNSVKNSIGIFKNPEAVFINPVFLKTLPDEEVKSGFAEMLKHALIADATLWNDLKRATDFSNANWDVLIERSLHIKKKIVEADPFEKGQRKSLNFGHTIGHALESFSLDTQTSLSHGHAVAIGMICESWLAYKKIGLPEHHLKDITTSIQNIYPPFRFEKSDFPAIFDLMQKDKKNKDGQISFTMIPKIGEVVWDQFIEEDLIIGSFDYYLSF